MNPPPHPSPQPQGGRDTDFDRPSAWKKGESGAGSQGRSPTALAVLLIGLVIFELAWLVWFLFEPLPNAGNVGGQIRRWIFLARGLPEVVPGVRFAQSYLGMALAELSHVENLPQRIP